MCLPSVDLARHVLVTGLTGAHKTTALTFPLLLDAARAGVSVVAFDLKYGERDSLASVAPEWWRRGRDVLVFAPLDAGSLRWNPLAACRSFGDAYEFAVHLFPDAPHVETDAAYWTGAERQVCAALVWALVSDGGGRSLARLRALAEAGPERLATYIRRHPRASEIAARLGTYSAMLPKDQAGILQGLAARLESWTDDRVAIATAEPHGAEAWDGIALERLRREPVFLIVGVPQAALPRLRLLCQLLMRMFAAHMLRPRAPDETVPVVYVLEELPAWGALPGLADHLATFRSRDVAIVATVQSEAQGQSVYGPAGWAAIAANFVTKIYFPSLADPDADRLSRALGTTVVEQVSHTWGSGSRGSHRSEHTRMIEVPLRRPEALQGIVASVEEIIVRCPGLPPARLSCPPFHARPAYARLVPDAVPSTVKIAVRHRLLWEERTRRAGSDPRALPVRAAPSLQALSSAAPIVPPGNDGDRDGDGGRGGDVDRDGLALSTFVAAALDRYGGSGRIRQVSSNGSSLRVIRRGDRLVEVRIDSAPAYRLLGDGDAAQTIVRRWAARRWVKHVRPVFVLERRALETLDADLRGRLLALASNSQ